MASTRIVAAQGIPIQALPGGSTALHAMLSFGCLTQCDAHPSAFPGPLFAPGLEGESREVGGDDATHGLAGRDICVRQVGAGPGRHGSALSKPGFKGRTVVDESVGAVHWIGHDLRVARYDWVPA